ncbi:MAG: hypothetical protein WCK37_04870 [Candidatus Falkowbacteria bacterium]
MGKQQVKFKPGRTIDSAPDMPSVTNNSSQSLKEILSAWFADVSGVSEAGQVKNPPSHIVFARIFIGFTFMTAIYWICKWVLFKYVGYAFIVQNYYGNACIEISILIVLSYLILWIIGKTSGPESVFRWAINGLALFFWIINFVAVVVWPNNNYDKNGNALKWYHVVNGKIVELQKETNVTDTTKKGIIYFIDCKSGDTCYRLTPEIRKRMESQSTIYTPISASNPDNDTLLMPQNKAYRFILDSGQVTKVLTFPNGKLNIIWRSNLGKFVVWADTNGDGIIDSNDESKAPDAAYTSFGTYKKVRVKFEGVARDTVYVLVTK